MNKTEALSKLELEEGATSSEINTQYQEFYNEFQMRITNAPTEHQRKLYQKKLEELLIAFEVLGGENSESNTQELPGIAESDIVETVKRLDSSGSNPIEMSKEKALQILGLGEKFTSKELQNAFKSKVLSCEKGRGNAINDSIREGYESAIIECNSAHNLLKDYILIAPPILKVAKPTPKISNNSSTSKKKWLLPVSIVSGVIIVVILFFAFGNGNTNIDPATHDKYVSLKSQADLLAKQGNWEDALSKYNKAYSLDQTSDVNDSIISMTNHLLLASIKKNGDSDELTKATNNEKKLNNEDNVLKNKKEVAAANKEKELEARENVIKEAESLRKEKESLRLKIGDKYAGGIVFKIDAGGEHGLVCAPTDQGSKITPNEAKNVCLNLTLNGYSDWYLPSKYELNLIYINIGRGSSNGNIGKGISIGNNGWTYWSSTEGSVTYQAWEQSFWDGNQHENYTGNCLDRCFRAIRAF